MGRYAEIAEDNWRKDAPDQYALIKDKPGFFRALGDEAQEQIDSAMDASPAPAGETFAQRAKRLEAVRELAEELVSRELLTPPLPPTEALSRPTGIPVPEPETPEDQDFRQAMSDFQDAATEYESLRGQQEDPTTA